MTVGIAVVVGLAVLALIAYAAGQAPPRQTRQTPIASPAPQRPKTRTAASPARSPVDLATQRAAVARHLGQQYVARQEQLSTKVAAERQRLRIATQAAATSADFQRLTALHRTSYLTADSAYAHLTAARNALRSVGESIGAMKDERTRRHRSRQPFDDIRMALNGLHRDREAIQAYRDSFKRDVDDLNLQTRALKLKIRDSCGTRGRTWYDDLERRIAARRTEH